MSPIEHARMRVSVRLVLGIVLIAALSWATATANRELRASQRIAQQERAQRP